ncbi:MAG: hypothetical protein DMG96_25150 [Acidobacteria bacterium]|nr:MAG: hypothetical protein DMG96_25150 [Acidobacteriota bacterium]
MTSKRVTRLSVLIAVLSLPAVLAAQTTCPPTTPAPGSTVNGGLDVVGTCVVNQVTVNGGITIESGGHLQLTSSTVNGGIVTLACGEIDVNVTTNGGGAPTDTKSSVYGGINITASDVCPPGAMSDADIWTAQIQGGISITGTFLSRFTPLVCNNRIKGNIVIHSVTSTGFTLLTFGDPDESPDGVHPCLGNTITGAFILSDSTFKVESNVIGGSALLMGNNTLEFNGNTIGGSAKCSSGTVIVPGEPPDSTGNTVHGSNQCPF